MPSLGSVEPTPTAVPGPLDHLLQLVGEGGQGSFREMYDLTSARVFGMAKASVQDSDRAADVTRKVYIDIWQLAAGFDRSAGSAIDWITALTRTRSIESIRLRQTDRRGQELTDPRPPVQAGVVHQNAARPRPVPPIVQQPFTTGLRLSWIPAIP